MIRTLYSLMVLIFSSLIATISYAYPDCEDTSPIDYMDYSGKAYTFSLKNSDVQKTEEWNGEGEPMLTLEKAIQIANSQVRKINGWSNADVKLTKATLRKWGCEDVPTEHYIYEIAFDGIEVNKPALQASVIVYFDGSVHLPIEKTSTIIITRDIKRILNRFATDKVLPIHEALVLLRQPKAGKEEYDTARYYTSLHVLSDIGQYLMSAFYLDGLGIPKNKEMGMLWLTVAKLNGYSSWELLRHLGINAYELNDDKWVIPAKRCIASNYEQCSIDAISEQ